MSTKHWKLNTSNVDKQIEFKKLFAAQGYTLDITHKDIHEIAADPHLVIAHKASQVEEGTLVEDTSLDIEGAEIGIHIRWLIDHLPQYQGRAATWIVLLAKRQQDKVKIYRGLVHGTLVPPRGLPIFGFDPIFLPQGASHTLAEAKSAPFNARALAVQALLANQVHKILPPIYTWKGPYQ